MEKDKRPIVNQDHGVGAGTPVYQTCSLRSCQSRHFRDGCGNYKSLGSTVENLNATRFSHNWTACKNCRADAPGPRPAPWPACPLWMRLILLAKSGSREVNGKSKTGRKEEDDGGL